MRPATIVYWYRARCGERYLRSLTAPRRRGTQQIAKQRGDYSPGMEQVVGTLQ